MKFKQLLSLSAGIDVFFLTTVISLGNLRRRAVVAQFISFSAVIVGFFLTIVISLGNLRRSSIVFWCCFCRGSGKFDRSFGTGFWRLVKLGWCTFGGLARFRWTIVVFCVGWGHGTSKYVSFFGISRGGMK